MIRSNITTPAREGRHCLAQALIDAVLVRVHAGNEPPRLQESRPTGPHPDNAEANAPECHAGHQGRIARPHPPVPPRCARQATLTSDVWREAWQKTRPG